MQPTTKWLTLVLSLTGVLVLATAFSGTIVSKTHADDGDEGGCSGAALSGVYAATIHGFVGTGAASQPIAAAGPGLIIGGCAAQARRRRDLEFFEDRGRDVVNQQKEQLRAAYDASRQAYREKTTAGAEPPTP